MAQLIDGPHRELHADARAELDRLINAYFPE
jgi:hypothetical protein